MAGQRALAAVRWRRYDFIDLGCGEGGSIDYCQQRFGARRGLGLDSDPDKIARARAAGIDAMLADARSPLGTKVVRFVAMMDFLEHLPNLDAVESTLRHAAAAATDFLFIRHPSFEGEAYLAQLGLRQYWWNWLVHPAHIHVSDYCVMFERLGLHQYEIRYRQPIHDSSHPSILPAHAALDQEHDYDPIRHGPKPTIPFAETIWRAQDIFVALRRFTPTAWAKIVTPVPSWLG